MKALVISDVDGCMTTGTFIYTADGKVGKIFGAGDHEGVKLLKNNGVDVEFITADRIGYPITEQRIVKDMHCKCSVISEKDRFDYIAEKLNEYDTIIFFGDGPQDSLCAQKLVQKVSEIEAYNNHKIIFCTPQNGRPECKELAEKIGYITPNSGGYGAFLDMSIWLCNALSLNQLYY